MRSRIYLMTLMLTLFALGSGSCKKESSTTVYQISGLWEGTYVYKTQPPLYFSFTIYPDGTMSYKSKGINGYIFYATGNWTLSGNIFTYTVTTTNNPGGVESNQTGTATYHQNGTLSDGTNTDVATGESGTFSMSRIN